MWLKINIIYYGCSNWSSFLFTSVRITWHQITSLIFLLHSDFWHFHYLLPLPMLRQYLPYSRDISWTLFLDDRLHRTCIVLPFFFSSYLMWYVNYLLNCLYSRLHQYLDQFQIGILVQYVDHIIFCSCGMCWKKLMLEKWWEKQLLFSKGFATSRTLDSSTWSTYVIGTFSTYKANLVVIP